MTPAKGAQLARLIETQAAIIIQEDAERRQVLLDGGVPPQEVDVLMTQEVVQSMSLYQLRRFVLAGRIMVLRADGMTADAVARQVGVSRRTVFRLQGGTL